MQNKDAQIRHAQQELLNELSRQIIAGTLELGTEQVIDVLDEPPARAFRRWNEDRVPQADREGDPPSRRRSGGKGGVGRRVPMTMILQEVMGRQG